MSRTQLPSNAWRVLILNLLYQAAEGLCAAFVGVYFYVNSLEFTVVCWHYLVLFTTTPIVFVLAGWYSQARDRLHVFRLGLLLCAAYYALLLYLKEDSANYPMALGAVLGTAWGLFWAGNNALTYDVTIPATRDRFFGLLSALQGSGRFIAPLVSGLIIALVPGVQIGYQIIFAVALVVYLASFAISFGLPADAVVRKFEFWRAMFPKHDQRDWQLILMASLALCDGFYVSHFMLALLMYKETVMATPTGFAELMVGSYIAFQSITGILTSYLIGRYVRPHTRKRSMLYGCILFCIAGVLLLLRLDVWTLVVFGFLRAVALPLFIIPHSSIRFDVIDAIVSKRGHYMEYLCAWEVPLGVGRALTLTALILCSGWLDTWGIRIVISALSLSMGLAYLCIAATSVVKRESGENVEVANREIGVPE